MFYRIYFYFTLFISLLILIFFFQTGFWEKNKFKFLERINLNGIDNYRFYPKILSYKVISLFQNQKKIEINISQKDMIEIEDNREEILNYLKNTKVKNNSTKFKHLFPFKEASAKIKDKENFLRTSVRLKGDRMIHYENSNKSSYRFKIKDGDTYDGMNKFSLQKPRIRNYLHEWVFHELLGEGDLVKIKYDFYKFYLNGEYKGYYVLEESFGNRLLKRNNLPKGPIFSTFEEFNKSNGNSKKMFEVYDKKFWTSDTKNLSLTRNSLKKIENYLKGKENFNNVFDVKKWAWFFAVTDLTYTYHGTLLKSVKFYYNPDTLKFEPIGFDGHRTIQNFSKYNKSTDFDLTNFSIALQDNENKGYSKIFPKIQNGFFFNSQDLNYEFYEEYSKAIKLISSKKFLENFFKERKDKIKNINSGIYSDDFEYDTNSLVKTGIGIYYYDLDDIYTRADILKKKIYPNIDELFVYLKDNQLIIENKNYNNFFLKEATIVCKDYNIEMNDLKIFKKRMFFNNTEKFNNSCDKLFFKDKLHNKDYYININKYN